MSMISPMIEDTGPMLRRHPVGELLGRELQPLGGQLAGAVDVDAPVELDVDDRQADARGGADALHAGRTVERGLDGQGDQDLDLLGRQPTGLGHHRDRRTVEVREDVDRQPPDHDPAVDQHERRPGDHEGAVLEREADDAVEHRFSMVSAQPWRAVLSW